tara:strand:+ start:121 stop:852 length:732 start_codon:yes stop_codon:yes gene_type:complete
MDFFDKNLHNSFYPIDKNIHPKSFFPDYKSSILRSPKKHLVSIDTIISDLYGNVLDKNDLGLLDNDLTKNFNKHNEPIGERIVVYGKLLDENSKPIPNSLIEIWQANSGGKYRHSGDTYNAPLDPNFGGWGRCLTDENGNYYFKTIKPGAYPWPNGGNNWRPAHIHFSIFGLSFLQRLVTQMYFEGDPLITKCPIAQSINNKKALESLISKLDINKSIHMDYIAYQFNITLRGDKSIPFEKSK